jgi:hypothetical protein
MGCFPCDTRLEAFPPYLSRVRPLARLLSFSPQFHKALAENIDVGPKVMPPAGTAPRRPAGRRGDPKPGGAGG